MRKSSRRRFVSRKELCGQGDSISVAMEELSFWRKCGGLGGGGSPAGVGGSAPCKPTAGPGTEGLLCLPSIVLVRVIFQGLGADMRGNHARKAASKEVAVLACPPACFFGDHVPLFLLKIASMETPKAGASSRHLKHT